jgi:hypothetical protein
MKVEKYDSQLHLEGCTRIWREVSWLPDHAAGVVAMERYFKDNPCLVAEIDGEAEGMSVAVPGTLRHLGNVIPFLAVTSVTVGNAGRKRGLGTLVTGEATARGASEGCMVAALGIFEQGFYNRLGYGNGPYNRIVTFCPSDLPRDLPYPERVCRLGYENLDEVYSNLCDRMPCHGQAVLGRSFYDAELQWESKSIGLGCRNADGLLTHHMWYTPSGERGPHRVAWLSYKTGGELLELLGLIRSLGDQVDLVIMEEPPHIQFQDLMRTPMRSMRMLSGEGKRVGTRTFSYTQARILDLPGALCKTTLPWGEVAFNLSIHDPISTLISEDCGWKGCAGDYTVVLGPECSAEPGHTRGLEKMDAGIGAFTRLWLGVRPPSVLALTDEMKAPGTLLQSLDDLLHLPEPRFNCDF